ncbi:MAG: CPBP family intramembrane metalloprotease [Bacteroidales bacterium]|nr:CPBP family intramembrane metalloprotease [Bacteroidales bacterium]
MKTITRIILGVTLSIIIFGISIIASKWNVFSNGFFHPSFLTHTTMLIISAAMIYILSRKNLLTFEIQKLKIKNIFKTIGITVLFIVIINILITIILLITKNSVDEKHILLSKFSPCQIIIFVFFYASIAEEFLFRGLIQNFLQPIKDRKIKIFKAYLSLPVIISGILFGLSHLILLKTGASLPFIFRILVFTTTLGLLAGYYQEKYKSFFIAVIIHMVGNLPGVIASFVMI